MAPGDHRFWHPELGLLLGTSYGRIGSFPIVGYCLVELGLLFAKNEAARGKAGLRARRATGATDPPSASRRADAPSEHLV